MNTRFYFCTCEEIKTRTKQTNGRESTNDPDDTEPNEEFFSGAKWMKPSRKLKVLCKLFFTLLRFLTFLTIPFSDSQALIKAAEQLTRVVVDVSYK